MGVQTVPILKFTDGPKWQCLGGESLSLICRVICEDYEHRSSGVPDLLIWRMSDKTAKLVEVKGPGDTLMQNQHVRSSSRNSIRMP